MKSNHHEIGVGATHDLCLRVSVATLVSVQFDSPEDGRTMLALERTATLREIEGRQVVKVIAKPFGGGASLTNPQALKGLIGNFQYDSERSRQERDLRIHILHTSWEKLKGICMEQSNETEKGIIDSSPERELVEEFEDSLNIKITPDQFHLISREIIVEERPSETDNVRAEGHPTVRIYYVFEAWIESPELINMMLTNSNRYSDKDLQNMAWRDAQEGGRGRANAILVLGLDDLKNIYTSIPMEIRNSPLFVGEHQLEGHVLAILKDVDQQKYQRYNLY